MSPFLPLIAGEQSLSLKTENQHKEQCNAINFDQINSYKYSLKNNQKEKEKKVSTEMGLHKPY